MRASVQTLIDALGCALATPTRPNKALVLDLENKRGEKMNLPSDDSDDLDELSWGFARVKEQGTVESPDHAPYERAIIDLTLGHARLLHGDITGLEMIRDAWKVTSKLDGSLETPWESYMKEWIEEKTAEPITREYERTHTVAVLKHPRGNIPHVSELPVINAIPHPQSMEQLDIDFPDLNIFPPNLLSLIKVHDSSITRTKGARFLMRFAWLSKA